MVRLNPLSLSRTAFIAVPAVGIIVYMLTGFFRGIIAKNLNSIRASKAIQRGWSLVEALIWIAYFYWALYCFFSKGSYFAPSVVVLAGIFLLWISWFVIRDIVAGFALRIQNPYSKGQYIKIDDIEGKILMVRQMGLEIELQDGIVAKIPYNRLAGRIHFVGETKQEKRLSTFHLDIPAAMDLQSTTLKLRHLIVSAPWTDPIEEPRIELVEQQGNIRRFAISVHTHGGNFDALLEEYLRKGVSDA